MEQCCKNCRQYCGGDEPTSVAVCGYWDCNVLADDNCHHYDEINRKAGAEDE